MIDCPKFTQAENSTRNLIIREKIFCVHSKVFANNSTGIYFRVGAVLGSYLFQYYFQYGGSSWLLVGADPSLLLDLSKE